MTDTTDIKALREKFETLSQIGDFYYFAKDLLDQLEAERQRADNASFRENHLNDMLNDKIQQNVDLRAELAAMKGEQVPVAEIKFHPSTDKHPCMYWFGKQDRDFPVGTQFFTAQQKPVVLPQAHKVRAGVTLTGDERNVMIPCDDGNWLSRLDVEHSIKMAGGIAKDGE